MKYPNKIYELHWSYIRQHSMAREKQVNRKNVEVSQLIHDSKIQGNENYSPIVLFQ